ncbi:MAG: GNAT family N-acetyltransferase [Acidobacteriota bacterium]|nr:GNAT family N-acetyltransferase [Acidobacteriota bacterium]
MSGSLPGAASKFRDYRPGDFAELVALDQQCFEPGIAYSPYEMRRFLGLASREAIVVERNGRLAAFCIGYRSPSRTGRILTIDVNATERRNGIGRALLEEMALRLSKAGATETVLEVDVTNAGAIAFYERLGFRSTTRIPDYYGADRDAFEMVRRETPAKSTSSSRLLTPDP